MRKLIAITGLLAAVTGGSSLAQAHGPGPEEADGMRGKHRSEAMGGERAKRCAKPRRIGFVVKGSFLSGDAESVTLKVVRANRPAIRSGLVTVGESFTATPTNPERIRYVNRNGADDAQATDRVKAIGKLSLLRQRCSSDDFTPTVAIRKVKVIARDSAEEREAEPPVS